MLSKHHLKKLLNENYALLAILIGVVLVSLPLGPYRNDDTRDEFAAAEGVLTWGYPYLGVKGNLFNLPPLGFYTEAVFFLVFGASLENGVVLITLLGLASTVVVYLLGKELYSKSGGLFAAALFALAPWQLILTRAFLVDVECLFLSLLYLYFGILAIQKDSVKLALLSGFFFAAALLTKQYAVFMLIPLLLLWIYHRPRNPKHTLLQLGAFSLPALHATLIWYNIIMGKWLLYFVQHNDFADVNFPGVVPSYSFAPTFLINYGLGAFFFAAVIFSLTIGLLFWKRFPKKSVVFDLISVATIAFILGLDMYLGVNLNLKAPYTSAIKYTYQALPFFSLAAGSLAHKSASFIKSSKKSGKLRNVLMFSMGLIGLFLLISPLLESMNVAQQLTRVPHLIFRVQPDQDVGYNFVVFPPNQNNILPFVQFLGIVIILSGLAWASRPFIRDL